MVFGFRSDFFGDDSDKNHYFEWIIVIIIVYKFVIIGIMVITIEILCSRLYDDDMIMMRKWENNCYSWDI